MGYVVIFVLGWLIGVITGLVNGMSEKNKKTEKYKRALGFYARREHYEPWREEDEDRTDAFNLVDLDGGGTAREALGEGEGVIEWS